MKIIGRFFAKIAPRLFLGSLSLSLMKMQGQSTFEDQMDSIDRWLAELNSLGVNKRKNELNDKKELQQSTEDIKQKLYNEYKAAYAGA